MSTSEAVFIALVLAALYFLPSVIAYRRGVEQRVGILVANIVLGVTVVMWIALLIAAFVMETDEDVARHVRVQSDHYNASTKSCPDCITDVPKEARVCRHCQHRFA